VLFDDGDVHFTRHLLALSVLLWHSTFGSVLSQYRFCVAGVGLGVAYGLKFPTGKLGRYLPLFGGGASGSLSDVVYAYNVACVQEAQAYEQARKQKAIGMLVQNSSNGSPPPPSNWSDRKQ
jgi:hypothetical protein